MVLDGSSALLEAWTARVRAQWAARRAEASAGGSDGGAWLDGDAAEAIACDAAMAPIVTGEVNLAALDDLVRLCVEMDRLRHHASTGHDDIDGDGGEAQAAPRPDSTRAWEAVEQAIIGKTINFLLHSRVLLDLRTFHSTGRSIPVAIVWEEGRRARRRQVSFRAAATCCWSD
jgi:hypothetical protein